MTRMRSPVQIGIRPQNWWGEVVGSNPSVPTMEFNIIYQDPNLLVIDKPAGLVVFSEGQVKENTLIDYLLEKFPDLKNVGQTPRYGIIHRLDKDTSGILLIAKNNKVLSFFQNQFKEGRVSKKYLALVVGNLKDREGTIETLIGRSPKDRRKQKIYLPEEPESDKKRKAVTEYKILENFKNFSLIEVVPKTGRKHQIRAHLAYLGYPIAGDKLYGFKRQILPKDLSRQFLHATCLKIELPNGEIKEFHSDMPQDLKNILKNLNFNEHEN